LKCFFEVLDIVQLLPHKNLQILAKGFAEKVKAAF
jgi:hypothetical protein